MTEPAAPAPKGSTMHTHAEAQPHGPIEEVFPDVFFVTGTMKTTLMNAPWHFSRSMTIVREGKDLTIINSVRLDDAGLAALEALGTVKHVVRIGSLHGIDDAFYVKRYGAKFWAMPGMPQADGLVAEGVLEAGGPTPFSGCTVVPFRTTKLPECVLHVDRAGGILVACDALQNWETDDAFFSDESRTNMKGMGFFQRGNFGPVFLQVNEPKRQDYDQLAGLTYKHALCGHGQPLRDTAKDDYTARTAAVFGG